MQVKQRLHKFVRHKWKQLTMAFTAQSMLHAIEAQVIHFNSFEPRLSFGEKDWVQYYLLQ